METNQLFDSEPQSIKNLREACPKSYKQLEFEWAQDDSLIVVKETIKIKKDETVSKSKS